MHHPQGHPFLCLLNFTIDLDLYCRRHFDICNLPQCGQCFQVEKKNRNCLYFFPFFLLPVLLFEWSFRYSMKFIVHTGRRCRFVSHSIVLQRANWYTNVSPVMSFIKQSPTKVFRGTKVSWVSSKVSRVVALRQLEDYTAIPSHLMWF